MTNKSKLLEWAKVRSYKTKEIDIANGLNLLLIFNRKYYFSYNDTYGLAIYASTNNMMINSDGVMANVTSTCTDKRTIAEYNDLRSKYM